MSSDHRKSCVALRRVVLFLLLTPFVGGCAYLQEWRDNGFKVGPDYRRPIAPVAEDWIDFNDRRLIADQNGACEAEWWGAFGDPQLDRLVQDAYRGNLPLKVAALRVLEARSQRGIVASALLPQTQGMTGDFIHTQISRNGTVIGLENLPFRAFDYWKFGFDLEWELDVWGRVRRGIESSDANIDAQIEDYDDILVTLIADTCAAYVEVREFQQRLEYIRQNIETQRGALELAQARFKAGATSELDVTQAESNLAQTRRLEPALEAALRQANNRLCVLLGAPPRDLTDELGVGAVPVAPAEVAIGIPADLLRRRPDVRKAEREVARQSALIGVAVAELFPAFAINGSINWQANDFSKLFASSSNAGFINPSFNWALLNYGRIKNNIDVQHVRFQQLAVQYQETVLRANAEAEDAVYAFFKAQEAVLILEEAVAATQRSVELAERQYKLGAIDFNRVFNLQSALVTQQDALAAGEAETARQLILINRALGGGWQIRCPQRVIVTTTPPVPDIVPESSDSEVIETPPPVEATEPIESAKTSGPPSELILLEVVCLENDPCGGEPVDAAATPSTEVAEL